MVLDSEEAIIIKDKNGNSPLYYAIVLKHYDCVEFLLANKANVTQKCRDGNTPLLFGCLTSNQTKFWMFFFPYELLC